jgi:hypothetical protein
MMGTLVQPPLPDLEKNIRDANGRINRLEPGDRAFHDWYRFVLAFPPHLVRTYLQDFGLQPGQIVLDPFCGTGTTLIEAKLNGINSVGLEANPFAQFASSVKTDWDIDPDVLIANAQEIASDALHRLAAQGIDDSCPGAAGTGNGHMKRLDAATEQLLIKDSISPLPLHKTLVLLECLATRRNERYYGHLSLALANTLVYSISNLRFGPEVGVDKIKEDVPVIAAWLSAVSRIVRDLRMVTKYAYPSAAVHLADARQAGDVLSPESVHAVITSPPYPNEKDYTRTTRLESVMLGFINSKADLRTFKQQLCARTRAWSTKGMTTIAGSNTMRASSELRMKSKRAGSSSARHPASSGCTARQRASILVGWHGIWPDCGMCCAPELSLLTSSVIKRRISES